MKRLPAFLGACLLLIAPARPDDIPAAPPDDAARREAVASALAGVDAAVARGPFATSWDSLRGYRVPEWYRDAKFGIFLHWGVYSVPAFGHGSEWYPRNLYVAALPDFRHHVETYGPQDKFGYKDFIPLFTAEHFDARAWARLFKEAGARYVVPVAEHHDGFALYDTAFSAWNAARMGPKRDLIAELAAAFQAEGLPLGLSNHRAEHWWFFHPGTAFPSDVRDPRYAGLYGPARVQGSPADKAFLDEWLARNAELVDKFHPQLMWFDWWIGEDPGFEPYLRRFAAYFYNRAAARGDQPVLNYKYTSYPEGTAVLDIERGQLDHIRPAFWQTDTSIYPATWGYVAGAATRPARAIVKNLADIVSKNGALLLNVGPTADGRIPDEAQAILRGIGRWLSVNGEAIYGTRPFKIFGEGPTEIPNGAFSDGGRKAYSAQDIRFTVRGDTLYAIVLAPQPGDLLIRSLREGNPYAGGAVAQVELLGRPGETPFTRSKAGLSIPLPPSAGSEACVLRITGLNHLAWDGALYPRPDGTALLDYDNAVLPGGVRRIAAPSGGWLEFRETGAVSWTVRGLAPGRYALTARTSAEGSGATLAAEGAAPAMTRVPQAADARAFGEISLGTLAVAGPDAQTITLRASPGGHTLRLASLLLTPQP